mmetsp:Transcript_35037/g.75602  ORF Transcript_35037/g.75602 Transcript_35037/m.75602 type:complete len:220 (+) Transcript_35037:377-1036(+)
MLSCRQSPLQIPMGKARLSNTSSLPSGLPSGFLTRSTTASSACSSHFVHALSLLSVRAQALQPFPAGHRSFLAPNSSPSHLLAAPHSTRRAHKLHELRCLASVRTLSSSILSGTRAVAGLSISDAIPQSRCLYQCPVASLASAKLEQGQHLPPALAAKSCHFVVQSRVAWPAVCRKRGLQTVRPLPQCPLRSVHSMKPVWRSLQPPHHSVSSAPLLGET